MKLLKLLPLLLMFAFFNSSANAAQDCDEMKGNIVGKLFCKAKSNYGTKSSGSEVSNSTEEEVSNSTEEESTGWKIWKKPEWMKKKN